MAFARSNISLASPRDRATGFSSRRCFPASRNILAWLSLKTWTLPTYTIDTSGSAASSAYDPYARGGGREGEECLEAKDWAEGREERAATDTKRAEGILLRACTKSLHILPVPQMPQLHKGAVLRRAVASWRGVGGEEGWPTWRRTSRGVTGGGGKDAIRLRVLFW